MAAEDQVKAIIQLLAPDQLNQTDALFLVELHLKKSSESLKSKDKQIALLEEEVEDVKKNVHFLANRNLETQAKAQEKIEKILDGPKEEVVRQIPIKQGKTL